MRNPEIVGYSSVETETVTKETNKETPKALIDWQLVVSQANEASALQQPATVTDDLGKRFVDAWNSLQIAGVPLTTKEQTEYAAGCKSLTRYYFESAKQHTAILSAAQNGEKSPSVISTAQIAAEQCFQQALVFIRRELDTTLTISYPAAGGGRTERVKPEMAQENTNLTAERASLLTEQAAMWAIFKQLQ